MDGYNKLRIAFVTNEFVTEEHFYGGLANYTYRAAKELVSLGHCVYVVTYSKIDEVSFDHDGIHVCRVGISPLPVWLRWLSRENAEGSITQRIYFNIQVYYKLRDIHKKYGLDIVQFTNVYASGLLSSMFLHVPYVIRVSSYRPLWNKLDQRKQDIDHKFHEWLEWLQLRLCRHIYAPSYKMKEILKQRMNIKDVRVIRPPAYIETDNGHIFACDILPKDKDYLLFFGRLQIRKGFHILARALPDFLRNNPDAYVLCVGPDYKTAIAASMREYACSLCEDFADRIVFMNQKAHKELYSIIAGAKVVVLPSLMENLSNACLEAMLLGKPLIGTYGSSFEELIIDGENGFLTEPGNVDLLAAKINEVWNYPKLDKIGYAARQKIQEFAPENTIKELLRYFEEVIRS